MKKIGLALSGGGFRASLYHLGLVRFLRDAGILPQVSHITSVSGGSIFAAHLTLNWGRYNGSDSEFDSAASELLTFVRLDVRNRITRRFPLTFALRWPRWLLGRSNRKLTRTGLLEYHYEKHLYGDTSLFQLPESPQLHILATNLSEGCLCSFNRNGLWMMRRQSDHTFRLDRSHIGLATVPMAVTASSAFPGFFPPVELTGADVGASAGEFGRQRYTDGGVFDNLGIRMFRFLEQVLAEHQSTLDGVLVSDVGKPFEVQSIHGGGGVIRTALRATDILMDRVWQLENDTFKDTPGFVFARITAVVEPHEDSTALHPEIQRQAAKIRTDLDCFSSLEISSLVRHGYCVARKACRAHPALFGADLPANAPWDPIPDGHGATTTAAADKRLNGPDREPAAATLDGRMLQASAQRRIWSTLLDYRDWTSYVYLPIIVPLLILLPYVVFQSYQRSHQINQIVESLAQGSRDLELMTRLLQNPVTPWVGESAEELSSNDKLDFKGFLILQDSRIIDLRGWKSTLTGDGGSEPGSLVYGYRRLKVLKQPDNTSNHLFRTGLLPTSPKAQVRFPQQQLKPTLRVRSLENTPRGEKQSRWEMGVDFQKIPPGDSVDLIYEHLSAGEFLRHGDGSTTLTFDVEAETTELIRWLLMPQGKNYRSFRLIRYETGKPGAAENVKLVTEYLADDYSILAFKLLSLKAGYSYELTWYYR
jgi:predicted acylesterase/phospholipase RssA